MRPNKWFVLFCGALIVVWVLLQMISSMRICDEAKYLGSRVYTWEWSGADWQSQAEMKKADVVKRTATDAIVKVYGRQVITKVDKATNEKKSETVDCQATLSLYRSNNNWVLGKVEFN